MSPDTHIHLSLLATLVFASCSKESAPLTPTVTLGMTGSEFRREFPDLPETTQVSDDWKGRVSAITIKDHANESVLLREAESEVSVTLYRVAGASTHIRPLARRPLREVIAYLEKDIPALLSKAGWKEVHSLADHWYSVYEYKCGTGDRYKFVRWEMEMANSIAPDQIEFGIMCESLDLDSPAGAFIRIRSGGGSLKTSPSH